MIELLPSVSKVIVRKIYERIVNTTEEKGNNINIDFEENIHQDNKC